LLPSASLRKRSIWPLLSVRPKMKRLPSGAQLGPNSARPRGVSLVDSDPSGEITAMNVSFENVPRLKAMRPLFPGKVAPALPGVRATTMRAASVAVTFLIELLSKGPPEMDDPVSLTAVEGADKRFGPKRT
jgi:hypothetical protein